MKKIFILLLCLCSCWAISACSTQASSNNSTDSASGKTTITLGETIQIDGQGAAAQDNTVTISTAGTYSISGKLAGKIVVDAENAAVTLELAGAEIKNSDGPAILFSKASEAKIILQEGTKNTLTDGGESDYDSALYSCASLAIDGAGELIVTGNNQEGIASEEHLTINNGKISVFSQDDGLNANQDNVSIITINGGYLYIKAEGDGIDSNGSMVINGGTVITLSALSDMSGGVDVDGDFTINGGTLIATGASNSLPGSSSKQQALSFNYKTTQAAGTLARIQQNDNILLSFAPEKDYQTLLYSGSNLSTDTLYQLYSGGTMDSVGVDGLYADGIYTDGVQQTHRDAATVGDFSSSAMLTSFNSVTYLTDTDFTSQTMSDKPRQGGSQPPQSGAGAPPDRKGEKPPQGNPPNDGKAPAEQVAPAAQ